MTDLLKEHQVTVSIGGCNIKNFCFANDIDGLGDKEEEHVNLVKNLDKNIFQVWYGD